MINFKNPEIFLVEDEPSFAKLIEKTLISSGYKNITTFHSGEDCIKKLEEKKPDIVFQDFDLPGMNGMDVLLEVKKKFPETEFVFLSGQSSIKIAVDTIKNGAFDYIIKDEAAQQNVIQKLKKVLLVNKLMFDKQTLKIGKRIFLILAIISWFVIALLVYFDILKERTIL